MSKCEVCARDESIHQVTRRDLQVGVQCEYEYGR